MVISELKCPKCDLRVRKDMELCPFCQLDEENAEFLKMFLRTEGKITDLEKALGLSYPSIKARIENLLRALQLKPIEEQADPIEALSKGRISVDEAVAILSIRRKK